jgi:hypothetical protein
MISDATIEPMIDPATTSKPMSRANAAPAKESSEMPWTAKGMSRAMTKTLMRPPTTPRSAAAMSELASSATNSP